MTNVKDQAPSASTDESVFLWYTVEKGGQAGPWSSLALRERIAEGKVAGDTLVWTQGMSDWRPVASLDIFGVSGGSELQTSQELPTHGNADKTVSDSGTSINSVPRANRESERSVTPRPWRRWFARMIDIWSLAFAFGVVIAVGGASKLGMDGLAFYGALLVFMVVAETLLIATVGSTAGKALMNIRVKENDGSALTWRRALSRTVGVWIAGEGLGIPIVCLFTMVRQHNELKANGTTTYDAGGRFQVTYGEVGAFRLLLLIVAIMAILSVAMRK